MRQQRQAPDAPQPIETLPDARRHGSFHLSPELGALSALLIIGLILTFANKYFLTASNMINLSRQVSIMAIVAVGMTMVIISGGIDLSVGSIVSVSGVVVAGLIYNNHVPSVIAVPIVLCLGILLGLINGGMIALLKLPPIIATLATSIAYGGLALVYTNGYAVPLVGTFKTMGRGYLGPIPVPAVIMICVYILGYLVLKYTKLGRMTYGLGGNEEAVRLSGIPTKRFKMSIYAFSGLTASLAGVVLASRLSSGQPIAGQGMELDAIAAAVIGGTSIFGGSGTVQGTLVGAVIILVINNGLNLMNVSPYAQMVAKGLILAFAVSLNSIKGFKRI